jgi:hypothetical protein
MSARPGLAAALGQLHRSALAGDQKAPVADWLWQHWPRHP